MSDSPLAQINAECQELEKTLGALKEHNPDGEAMDALLAMERKLADAEKTIAEQQESMDALLAMERKLADAEKTIAEQQEEEPSVS